MAEADVVSPCFYYKVVPGRDPIPYVEIRIPGDTKTVLNRKVLDKDIERWPDQWAQFQKTGRNVMDGLPLTKWSAIPIEVAQEYEKLGVYTVQQLALMADHLVPRLGPGARKNRQLAIAWVAAGDDPEGASRTLSEQNERIVRAGSEIESLKTMVSDLQKKLAGSDHTDAVKLYLAEKVAELRRATGDEGATAVAALTEAEEAASDGEPGEEADSPPAKAPAKRGRKKS